MAYANWLQDASLAASQIIDEASAKQIDYATYLDMAEDTLASVQQALVKSLQTKLAILKQTTVVIGKDRHEVSDVIPQYSNDDGWTANITVKQGKPIIVTTKSKEPIMADDTPAPVAKVLESANQVYNSKRDAIGDQLNQKLKQLLKGKAVSITNPQKLEPLEVTVLDVTVAPNWEDQYEITLLYTNPTTNKRSSYVLTSGYDRMAFVVQEAKEPTVPIDEPILISGGSASSGNVPFATKDQPSFVIKATAGEPVRAIIDGKVKRLYGRALARLMGVPDSYPLPTNEPLAKTVLGNGVPPLVMRAVVGPLIRQLGRRIKGATMFSGGGLVELGLKDMVTFIGAVEKEPAIAAHYKQAHGDHVIVGDVQTADISGWKDVEYFHASPVCKDYSDANLAKGEQPLDISTAQATANAIKSLQPVIVSVENVAKYGESAALAIIKNTLDAEGYDYDVDVYDSADYGVPQHRQRLLLRAVKRGKARLLPPEGKKPLVSWWDAVKDLELPDDPKGLAPWQLYRLQKAWPTRFGTGAPAPKKRLRKVKPSQSSLF